VVNMVLVSLPVLFFGFPLSSFCVDG